MGKLIRGNYYQDGLTKYECLDCELEFIVGTDLAAKHIGIRCPYCGAREYSTQAVAEMREDLLGELGCMGIYYDLTPLEEELESSLAADKKMKFYMCNCLGDEAYFDSENMVNAIHTAWNIEATLYRANQENKIVFSPFDDNEFNNEILEEYGLRIIDNQGYRKVQSIETGEIYNAPWDM